MHGDTKKSIISTDGIGERFPEENPRQKHIGKNVPEEIGFFDPKWEKVEEIELALAQRKI